MTTTLQNHPRSREGSTPGAVLELNVLTSWTEIEADWKSLELKLGNQQFSCSSTWITSWLDVYASQMTPYFLRFRMQQTTVATLLVMGSTNCTDGPLRLKTLHLGTAGERLGHSAVIEYNQILCDPQFRHQVLAQLLDWMSQQKQYDELRFDGIDAVLKSELLQMVPETLSTDIYERPSLFVDLDPIRESGQQVVDQLGKSTRQNLRRRIRKFGEPTVEWATNVSEAEEIFTELVDLHQQRWTEAGLPGAFASDQFSRLQRAFIPQGHPLGLCQLARVKINDTTLGCNYYWNDRNRLLGYVSGFASFSEFPSSGLVAHYLCLEDALVRGFSGYDFLVGENQYKRNLSTSESPLHWVRLKRPRWKYRLLNAFRQLKRWLQNIQHKPSSEHDSSAQQA